VQAGGKVKVPTTLNSVSADRQRWQALGVPEEYALASIALGDAYLELGCQPSFTCAPYLLQSAPVAGQDIAWGESNAVVYANSVTGARTEKYADYLDICCAIAGIVPAAGVHLAENRRPRIVLDGSTVFAELKQIGNDRLDMDLLFPTLGHLCGTLSVGRVPIVLGLEDWTISTDHFKAFCAAFGTTGSSPLIHIAGVTPEAKDPVTVEEFVTTSGDNVRTIVMHDLEETFQLLDVNAGIKETIDLVALGNPHLSVSECQDLAQLIRDEGGSRKHADTRIIACMSRSVHEQADARHLQEMKDFGVEFVFDTCWCMLLDEPIVPVNPAASILTNSGKYAHYGPGLTNRQFRFGSMSDCIQAAKTGVYPSRAATQSVSSPLMGSSSSAFLAKQRRNYTTIALHRVTSLLRRWR
jgi:cis-L-3-hydroxyproline dehydratase